MYILSGKPLLSQSLSTVHLRYLLCQSRRLLLSLPAFQCTSVKPGIMSYENAFRGRIGAEGGTRRSFSTGTENPLFNFAFCEDKSRSNLFLHLLDNPFGDVYGTMRR